MLPRSLAPLGLFLLTIGTACDADDKPAQAPPPAASASIQRAVKDAIEAQGKGDMPRAIGILEAAAKDAPDEPQVLFALGALSLNAAEDEGDKPKKASLLHKAGAAFRHLRDVQPKLTPTQASFVERAQVGEVRALAIEGKDADALASLQAAVAAGYSDFESLDEEADLAPVRALPGYAALVMRGVQAAVDREFAEARPFPFTFILPDLADKNVSLADFKGKVTIVDLWGTWCPPCRKEIPHFVALDREFRAKGLAIVGINCNESGSKEEVKSTIRAFVEENKIPYPCLLDDDKTQEKVPGFRGYPTTLFLDRAGKVRLTLVGYTSRAKLDAIVARLLAEPAPR